MRGDHSYSADGMGMKLLELLERGNCTYSTFRQSYDNARRRQKCWFVIRALTEDGFIERVWRETYAITEDGREALADLRAGFSVSGNRPAPTVRIFTEARA